MPTYEYSVLYTDADGENAQAVAEDRWIELLNAWGKHGWELVTEHHKYFPGMTGSAVMGDVPESVTYRGTVKRQTPE